MTQQMSSPILVLADQAGDHLTPLARQAVTLAASLTSADVVRHELVGAIIDAYQRYDDRNAARRARTRSHNTARREYTS